MAAKNYKHLNANGTFSCSVNPCELVNVNINGLGAAANTLTLTDDTGSGTGTVIAVFTTTGIVSTFNFGVQCLNGLTATLATGTAADVTLVFG